VTVQANANTGLVTEDVFYFGCAIGETGDSPTDANITPTDIINLRANPHTLKLDPAAIDDDYDFNRDRKVGPTDEVICRNHATYGVGALQLIAARPRDINADPPGAFRAGLQHVRPVRCAQALPAHRMVTSDRPLKSPVPRA